ARSALGTTNANITIAASNLIERIAANPHPRSRREPSKQLADANLGPDAIPVKQSAANLCLNRVVFSYLILTGRSKPVAARPKYSLPHSQKQLTQIILHPLNQSPHILSHLVL